MAAYILVQERFRDLATYRRYQAAFPAVFAKFNGRVLIADGAPVPLEGELNQDKIVLLEFPDADEARRFVDSSEYREIASDRRLGADAVFTLLKGFEPQRSQS
ncbi:MAG TPA: DUF1330 domain-containing protein [Rhizomicrobium sp.]|jgi:uncharacterized protein (DUF1330 family)|nr:DUF1330 domain-containing protein [Rhizomicrobium sp.]